ncbi:hypothetical protein DV515_00009163, partial [Chloebia gouldiae]
AKQFDDLVKVDYSLSGLPAVFQPFIDLDLKGIVFPAGNYSDSYYMAASFTIPDQSDSMLYLAFSEYFFQTSPFAYYITGAFNMTIAEEMSGTQRIGICSYFNINTKIFSSIIPEMLLSNEQSEVPLRTVQRRNRSPEMGEFQIAKCSVAPYLVMLKLMSTEIPVISLQQDSFTVKTQGSVEMFAILPDSTTQSLFTLKIVFLLENILSYILQTEVIPSANAKLSKGFPFPNLANVTLTRPRITIV